MVERGACETRTAGLRAHEPVPLRRVQPMARYFLVDNEKHKSFGTHVALDLKGARLGIRRENVDALHRNQTQLGNLKIRRSNLLSPVIHRTHSHTNTHLGAQRLDGRGARNDDLDNGPQLQRRRLPVAQLDNHVRGVDLGLRA